MTLKTITGSKIHKNDILTRKMVEIHWKFLAQLPISGFELVILGGYMNVCVEGDDD